MNGPCVRLARLSQVAKREGGALRHALSSSAPCCAPRACVLYQSSCHVAMQGLTMCSHLQWGAAARSAGLRLQTPWASCLSSLAHQVHAQCVSCALQRPMLSMWELGPGLDMPGPGPCKPKVGYVTGEQRTRASHFI